MSEVARRDPFTLMRDLLRWDPFSDVESLLGGTQTQSFVPDVSIKETPNAIELTVDVPGIPEENIEITVAGNRLTISGRREEEDRQEGERYLSYERSYGTFYRSFVFPESVDLDNVKAELREGVLHVQIPKKEGRQSRRIRVGGEAGRMGAAQTEAGQMQAGRTEGTSGAAGTTTGTPETAAGAGESRPSRAA
jgi:HSP20 family protein